MAKTTTYPPITHDQAEALRTWAKEYGRTWKRDLLDAWLVAGSRWNHYSPYLQQLRNQLGPSWLNQIKADLGNLDIDPRTIPVSYRTAVIAGHELKLIQGVRYLAGRPMAETGRTVYPVTIAAMDGMESRADTIIPDLTYDEANDLINVFNINSFTGRIW